MARKIVPSEFFEECAKKHNGKYTYHDDFVSMKTKIKITCPIHGDFYQEPRHHITGCSCPECSHKSTLYTNDEFVKMAKEVHGDKYEYLEEYKGRGKPIEILCHLHGVFIQKPYSHLSGAGCPFCANDVRASKLRIGWKEFIKKASKKHNNFYRYRDEYDYINNQTKVPIICPKHGEFWQTPNKHLLGCGCPICSNSILEKDVTNFLNKKNIKFIPQYNLFENKRMRLDFYLPEYNAAIECQGDQHFIPVEHFGGEKGLEKQNELDKIKYNFCLKNGIKLYYFSYNNKKNDFMGCTLYHDLEEMIGKILDN